MGNKFFIQSLWKRYCISSLLSVEQQGLTVKFFCNFIRPNICLCYQTKPWTVQFQTIDIPSFILLNYGQI